MPVPRREIVEPIIDKHRRVIVAAVQGGWADWLASPHPGIWRCKRSRANFVWEQIIDRSHRAFDGMLGVRIIGSQATFGFLVDDQVFFRFKKGDENGLSANVRTQLALAFHDHDQDLPDLLPRVERVEVVYQLNRLETQVVDIVVVARDRDVVVWTYSLLDAATGGMPLPMPVPSGQPPRLPASRLVRLRGASDIRDWTKRG